MDQGFSYRQSKSNPGDKTGPLLKTRPRGAKDNVVAVDLHRHRGREDPTERQVVLQTKQRETQKVTHQLPNYLLKGNSTVFVPDLTSQGTPSVLPKRRRNPARIPLHNLEQCLSNLERQVIRSSLVVSGDKNLPRHVAEISHLTRFGFTTKKPGEPRKTIVDHLVQRMQDPLLRRGDRHTTILPVLTDDMELDIPRDGPRPVFT
jgi:hypothetical protein